MYYLKFKNGIYNSYHQMTKVETFSGAKRYIKKLAKQNAPYKSIDSIIYIFNDKKGCFEPCEY